MRLTVLIFPVAVLICPALSGQRVVPQPQTFHIQGTVTDPLGAVVPNVRVTFKSPQSGRTVVTNDAVKYQADLPFGDYTMAAQTAGFKTYQRPLFRASAPSNLTSDVRLQISRCGDMVIVPVTDDAIYAATADCRHTDMFPLSPHRDEFQLVVQFEKRTQNGQVFSYTGASKDEPVALAYNLFSLHADHVIYDAKRRTIEARGNVVVEDASGKRSGDATTFKLEDGQAIQQP